MLNIKIDDSLFSHAKYSTDFQTSNNINWVRSIITGNEDIVFYTDNSLNRVNPKIKNKIAWLLESPAISDDQHDWIKHNHYFFDNIFTNNRELLELNEKFKFVPTGGCWIKPEDQKIYPKSKIVSIIASNKNWTDGHHLRNKIIENYKFFDLFGRGYNDIPYKLDGLKDYRYSIVVENTKKDYYFSEKLIDCFMTGTIPIYWGCPSIGDFFDINGILPFDYDDLDTLSEMMKVIELGLHPDLYNSKMDSIKRNFELAKEYIMAEDYMYNKYLKNKYDI